MKNFWGIILTLSLIITGIGKGLSAPAPEIRFHELTLFVIPSTKPLDWSSPAALYKSTRKNYVSTILRKEKYIIGHLFVMLSTPLLEEPLYTGMSSASRKEKRHLIFREKIGYALIGAAMRGRLETAGELTRKIGLYARRNELAFITYRINEQACRRILDYVAGFSSKSVAGHSPSDFYGGAFWPLYEHEGAGCSAFGIAMLDLANLTDDTTEQWKISVNIPMEIIGGTFNNNRKVPMRDVARTKSWHQGDGTPNHDFVPFWIYDPSITYQWVLQQHEGAGNNHTTGFVPVKNRNIPGVFFDARRQPVNAGEPIFVPRQEPNVFIEEYFYRTGIGRDH